MGSVAFVGAGPGDPELLTVRASLLLAAADVVVHDSDVPAELLDRARPDAQVITVGLGRRPAARPRGSGQARRRRRQGGPRRRTPARGRPRPVRRARRGGGRLRQGQGAVRGGPRRLVGHRRTRLRGPAPDHEPRPRGPRDRRSPPRSRLDRARRRPRHAGAAARGRDHRRGGGRAAGRRPRARRPPWRSPAPAPRPRS